MRPDAITYADMAAANWGTGWSVPTFNQLKTLINADSSNKCSVAYVTDGVNGIRITGTTDGYTSNSIFLPAAGYGFNSDLIYLGSFGYYWSSVQDGSSMAYRLLLGPIYDFSGVNSENKYCGFPVRPVRSYTAPTPTPSVLLPGEFSVSETKKVKFTKGNLYWDGSAFHIEANQTDYKTTWSTSYVSHFYWSKTATVAYAETYSDDGKATTDAFFCGEASPMTVDDQSSLYALSSAEWTYLLSSTGRREGDSKFKNGVTVNGVANCLVIAPDGYTGSIASSYDAASWSTAESLGLVCLAAAGFQVTFA